MNHLNAKGSAKGGSASGGKRQKAKVIIIGMVFFLTLCPIMKTAPMRSLYAEEADKFVYNNHGKPDPFIPLVGLRRAGGIRASEITSIDDVDFQGIAMDAKGQKIIIINGEMLKEGASLGALTVKKISDKEAIVIIRGSEYKLNLYEEGGGEGD